MKRTEIAETKLSLYVHVSRRSAARAALAACVIATLPAVGCRSGRSSWNLFSRSEPSAEVLAGSGPTTTYPAPPSSRARPEAIASIAGGTAIDKTQVASATPETESAETVSPANGTNPYALAGNRMKAPENGVPTGFPTGPVTPGGPPPTVSTTLAADDSAVPPSYALPGRGGVPSATSPSTPVGADGLPSGYQLGKEPVAGPNPAVASSSPISTSPNSSFAMPPLEGSSASGDPAAARSNGYSLPADMVAPTVQNVAAVPAASPASIPVNAATVNPANSPAIAALSLPPADSASSGTVRDTAGAVASPAYQTASATKSNSASGDAGAAPGGVQPAGYRPGSTGKSSGYPVLR